MTLRSNMPNEVNLNRETLAEEFRVIAQLARKKGLHKETYFNETFLNHRNRPLSVLPRPEAVDDMRDCPGAKACAMGYIRLTTGADSVRFSIKYSMLIDLITERIRDARGRDRNWTIPEWNDLPRTNASHFAAMLEGLARRLEAGEEVGFPPYEVL